MKVVLTTKKGEEVTYRGDHIYFSDLQNLLVINNFGSLGTVSTRIDGRTIERNPVITGQFKGH